MSNITRDDADRANNARFVRNLALSLSGGALLTVFAAGAAHADDLSNAGTVSDGAAGSKSGDATAIGNQSGTDASQGYSPSGQVGALQITNQNANAANVGVAVANTGGNIAIGNASTNTSSGTQTATNTGGLLGLAGAVNNGSVSNSSNGAAYILTGDATAVGNTSTTSIHQQAGSPAAGTLGGLVLINQNGSVLNGGAALANTGGNIAAGNVSTSDSTLTQIATGNSGGLATNSGSVGNKSDGLATIHTGDGNATGNMSHTTLTQDAAGSGGDAPGGLTIINQLATTPNIGLAVSNTGANAAIGNATPNNTVTVDQTAEGTFTPALSLGIVSNSAEVSNESNGAAEIATGDAWSTGNDSSTTLSQSAEAASTLLSGAVVTQAEVVVNAGVGIANSGGNLAIGNASPSNTVDADQTNTLDGALSGVVSNQAEVTNASDGTAHIVTGDAYGTGNRSATSSAQQAWTHEDFGVSVITQVGAVGNLGAGVGNSGGNVAVGNTSTSAATPFQTAELANPGGGVLNAVSNNSLSAGNASDGTATIVTGDAEGTGNDSSTSTWQSDPTASTQVAIVANAGLGLGNSGGNIAVGNASTNTNDPAQNNDITPAAALTAGQVIQNNSLEATNTSDGTAHIATGDAEGTGNHSHTGVSQDAVSEVDGLGLVVGTQLAGVANVGLGAGNSGVNVAVGNASTNGTASLQDTDTAAGGDILAGQIVSSNSQSSTNASDGSATIHTGDAEGTGNDSVTYVAQASTGTIDGLGLALNTQVAGVLNAGVGVGNSGVNAAIGNASTNSVDATQTNLIDADAITAGQVVNGGSLETGNASDGSALVGTGDTWATGNASRTGIDQELDTSVEGLGLVAAPQIGVVGNVGAALANSGANLALGNASTNGVTLTQTTTFDPGGDLITPSIVVNAQGEATNASDGEACACTGDATASGNVSDTMLTQDMDLGVEDGLSVIPTVGAVLNAGFGLANSGLNLAVGNVSTNTATGIQTTTLDPTLAGLVAPQVLSTSGAISNASDGMGKVGTGNASATGNLSTTGLSQAADVDASGPPAISSLIGTTANVGAGLANAGLSAGIGNASTNSATLDQTAEGAGLVSNSGEASNDSDGTGIVGDPNCEDEVTTDNPKPEHPGMPGLPRTGGPIELQVMAAVMLMLAGYGMRRASKAIS